MVYLLITLFIYFVPTLWVNYTLGKHDDELPNMPFTGSEFGNQVLKEKEITNVSILGDDKIGDHYDVIKKKVGVKSERLNRKSLTSITVVCHEIGHAIQDAEDYKPLRRRHSIIQKTRWISKIGNLLMYIGIPAIVATQSFPLIRLCIIIILIATLIEMLTHIVTLNVELDASFNRAMPIIEKKIPQEYHQSCKSILRVCAFTYVVAAMTSFLNLRNLLLWIRFIFLRR